MIVLLLLGVMALPTFAEEVIPLKQLYGIVKFYPRVSYCERNITSGYWMDYEAGNVRHITYTGQVKPGETARALCNCMNKHMTQKDWTEGAKRICYSQCDKVTYHLSGTPDPTYDPNAKDDANFDRPLEKLYVVFKNTPTTDPIGLKCDATCSEQSNIIHCSISCPLVNETRTDELCTEFVDYYDQNDWLVGASATCDVVNNVLQADFVGTS